MASAAYPTRERILFVDEHEHNCEAMTVLLSHRGYEVVTAFTLITTLLVARGRAFDLYVLDAEFWGAGAEVCRSIREFDPLTPIIFFSTAADESARR